MEDTGDTLEDTRPTVEAMVEAMEEAMEDTGMGMARDLLRLSLATATLAMAILAMEVMEDTEVMDMEPLMDLTDTDTIKRSQH